MSLETFFLSSPKASWSDYICSLLVAAKDFITGLVQKDPERRFTIKQALAHEWLTTTAGEEADAALPVPQNLTRHKTAKAETLYEGCEIARALTKHAADENLHALPEAVPPSRKIL